MRIQHPAHGGYDNGASYNGRKEKDDALRVTLAVGKKLEDAGVTFTELTDEERALWKEASLSFYEKGSQFGWSQGLYDTVKAAVQ